MPYIDTFEKGSTPYCGFLEDGYEIALQFKTNKAFSQFRYIAPNLGRPSAKVTLSLYEMKKSYTETRKSKPVAEGKFDFANGFMMLLDAPNTPAGEYLLVAHGGDFGIGFCARLEPFNNVRLWMNGCKCDGTLEGAILFDDESEEYFVPITNDIEEEKFESESIKKNIPEIDINNFTCIDGLGREIPESVEKEENKNREVGVFYWDWSYNFCRSEGINLQKLMERHPESKNEFYSTVWMRHSAEVYHWNEPLYGFYDCTDPYVVRRQAQALADAGVDFIVLDCTNGCFVWKKGYEALFKGFEEARIDGVKVPKIVFMLNFAPFLSSWIMARQIYTDIYKKGRYKDLWYYRDGKPLLICRNEALKTEKPLDNEILDFFSFRRNDPLYFTKEPETEEDWGWLSVCPQAQYGKKTNGKPEQMTVGVAQNASKLGLVPMNDERGGVFGRSHTTNPDYSYKYIRNGIEFTANAGLEDSKKYGLNFNEQWDYAIECDPDIIFVTGYNEWVAGRHEVWQGSRNAFPDEYNDEYSRDIEPTKGDLKDHYYNQLVWNVRRFKGAKTASFAENKKIDSISDWETVKSVNYYKGTAPERDYSGYGTSYYTDSSCRNTVVEMKSAYDKDNVCFYAKCEKTITDFADCWMNLYIRTDVTLSTWESFNFVVNRLSKGSVEISKGYWEWEKVADCDVTVDGDTISICIPRSVLGVEDSVKLDYKWADNTCRDGDILDFYTTGCVAPGERFTVPVRE